MIFLMHGYIGSGKTTKARELENSKRAIRFTPDEWMVKLFEENPPAEKFSDYLDRIFATMEKLWVQIARNNGNVILDFGFWTKKSREEIVAKLDDMKLIYTWVILETEIEECKVRNSKRGLSIEKTLEISENTFDLLASQFEPFDKNSERITNE